jgi:hypothetical protein
MAFLGTAWAADPFTFTKVDLQLLDECNAADKQLDSRGLIYHDPALEKHPALPQVERQLHVRVNRIIRFTHAPHTDVEEHPPLEVH